MRDRKYGRPKETNPRKHRYYLRLNQEENQRFRQMLKQADCTKNISGFIVKRIFAEPFLVRKIDHGSLEYYSRLNDFYYEYLRIGNNYNQVVKVVNSRKSLDALEESIPKLVALTQQLIDITGQVVRLTHEFKSKR